MFAIVIFLAIFAWAQNPPEPADRVAAIKQAIAHNQAALKAYTWTETTQVSVKGEVKKIEQKQCRYGPDGKVQKVPIPSTDAAQQTAAARGRGGRIKQAIVENKVEDLKEYMERAAALVHEYVPPDAQKIQAAVAAKGMSIQPDSADVATLTIKDYLKPGDTLALGFDSSAKQLRSYRVQSYIDKPTEDALTLEVTFASLPDGTSYPQQTILDVTARKVRVEITNSGYTKTGP